MTQSTFRAAGKVIIWGIVLAAFTVLFFGGEGPEDFAGDRGRIVTVAVLFAAGYAAFFVMLGFSGRALASTGTNGMRGSRAKLEGSPSR
jgi:hypothetical protein